LGPAQSRKAQLRRVVTIHAVEKSIEA